MTTEPQRACGQSCSGCLQAHVPELEARGWRDVRADVAAPEPAGPVGVRPGARTETAWAAEGPHRRSNE